MWRVWVILGASVWVATIGASATVNLMAGYELGRSAQEATVFGVLGVCADVWKAIGPIFLVMLWRSRKFTAAGLAAAVWAVCFAFAVSAALGLTARNRAAVIGGHEAVRLNYESVTRELSSAEEKRRALGDVGDPAEREAAMNVELAKPLPGGTVGSLSSNCDKDQWRARAGCAAVAELRRELANAVEGRRLDERIAALSSELRNLRGLGGGADADPQAALISRMTLGRIAAGDVGLLVTLLLVGMVELISAFAPVVVSEYVIAARAAAASRRRTPPVSAGRDNVGVVIDTVAGVQPLTAVATDLFQYLAERIVPDLNGSETIACLFDDYCDWCQANTMSPLRQDEFAGRLDEIARSDLGGRVVRRGSEYHGLRLASEGTRVLVLDRRAE